MDSKRIFTIRPAQPSEVPLILHFIRELAAYEKLSHEVAVTESSLQEHLFGTSPRAEVIFACEDEHPVGFALYFYNFSTFVGKPGIYLEDLYVQPSCRGKGYGKALMVYLARLTLERDGGRFEWSVLDWNTPSIDFYRSLGAVPMTEWTVQRVMGDALQKLAES